MIVIIYFEHSYLELAALILGACIIIKALHDRQWMQGIRNDDQSLSPVTSLASLLFLSFLIP